MHVGNATRTLLLLIVASAFSPLAANAQAPACDNACLKGFVDGYIAALAQRDPNPGGDPGRATERSRRSQDEVLRARGERRPRHLEGKIRRRPDELERVVQRHGLENRPQLVIAVRPSADHAQSEVDLGVRRSSQAHQRSTSFAISLSGTRVAPSGSGSQ